MSIKSSLEIALERTKDVQADPENLLASGFITAGKKLVPQFLNDPEFSLARKVREHSGKERNWVSEGVFEALSSNLALPSDEYGLKRNRRAMVTEAGGQKQSAILVAEGDKQSEILKAEGDRQATILRAEAEKEAQSLRAEGYATAISHVFQIAQTVDSNTMLIQYLQTLQNMAESPSTKWIFPIELSKLAGGLGGIVDSIPNQRRANDSDA